MKLIVGLGNPGEKYEKTRHNLGFTVLDALLQELTPVEKTEWKENKNLKSKIYSLKSKIILAKPQTFMNASGYAVAKLTKHYTPDPSRLFVVHDDIDLPLGKIKIKEGGGSAGHRGIDSIAKELETHDFVRFRLGIGHLGPGSSDKEVERYVLSPFSRGEKSKARRMVKKAVKAIELALEEGLERAINQFH